MAFFHRTADVTEEPPGLLPHPDTERESRDRLADRLREEGGQLPQTRPTVITEVESWIDPATVDNASYAERTTLAVGAHTISFVLPPGKRMQAIVLQNNLAANVVAWHPTGGTAGPGGPLVLSPGEYASLGGKRTSVSVYVPVAVQLNDPTTAGLAVYGKMV